MGGALLPPDYHSEIKPFAAGHFSKRGFESC
jgi:hypothetical protein